MGNGLIALRADGHLASDAEVAALGARMVHTWIAFEQLDPFFDFGLADVDSAALAGRALLYTVCPAPARGTLQHVFAVLAPSHPTFDHLSVLAHDTLAEI